MSNKARVRFKVPELELLHARVQVLGALNHRLYAEVLLSYLCCPGNTHPAVAQSGLDYDRLFALLPAKPSDHKAYYEFRWPKSVQACIEPALALAEMSLPELLASIWYWTHDPEKRIDLGRGARMASFASFYARDSRTWSEIHLDYLGDSHRVTPHKLLVMPDFNCARLPWVQHIKSIW